MASYNKIQLTGKLNDTPDVKATTSGHSISKFTLIVPRIEALPNQRFDYIRVTAWRENADKTANFKAGDIVFVDGRILTDSYEDASTGQRKWTTEVDAKQIVNFNEVFANELSNSSALPSTSETGSDSVDAAPIENIPIAPIDESAFFNDAPTNEESENELDEDVPF